MKQNLFFAGSNMDYEQVTNGGIFLFPDVRLASILSDDGKASCITIDTDKISSFLEIDAGDGFYDRIHVSDIALSDSSFMDAYHDMYGTWIDRYLTTEELLKVCSNIKDLDLALIKRLAIKTAMGRKATIYGYALFNPELIISVENGFYIYKKILLG